MRTLRKTAKAACAFYDLKPTTDDFRADAIAGLSQPQKTVPSKFFYDECGSRLFEQICMLDEYYPTRAEIAILRQFPRHIAALLAERAVVVEFGTGSSVKVRLLLDALRNPVAYVPIDISRGHLLEAAQHIAEDYPALRVFAICADFAVPVPIPQSVPRGPRIGFFPGSTIGNFTPPEARELLRRIAATLGNGGVLLIGVDLKKNANVLHAAYNDAEGVTAAFNLNLLQRMNSEIGSDFNLSRFAHNAFYNAEEGRVEMHLVSQEEQTVRIDDHVFSFHKGETIHTENAYKYAPKEFRELAASSGFVPLAVATDPAELFCLHCLKVA
jgi:dimethylhistidine N-methyltransferase